MKTLMTFAVLSLVIAGCSKQTAVVTVGDYCTVARPPHLHDGCAPGEVPTIGPNGFASCSALTFADATTLAVEIKKYSGRCESP
jgi:hypothetical protein